MPVRIERTCCFSGHREIPESHKEKLKTALWDAIESLIEKDVIFFGAGGARGFDTLASLVVLELRKRYPQIKLILVLPCKSQTRGWKKEDVNLYNWIKAHADKVMYTSELYFNGCMQKRNHHLVNQSLYCICYRTKNYGGTVFTVNYATSKQRVIYNIAEYL